MKLISKDNIFVAVCSYDERLIPKERGFRWDPTGKKWWTDSPEKASKLIQFADDACKEKFAEITRKREEALDASKAVSSDIDIPCPEGLAYLPFQRAGIEYCINKTNVLIADQMGLGKSIEAIGVINVIKPKNVLIVCPASLKINWRREITKWDISEGRIILLNSTKGFSEKERKGLQCLNALDSQIRSQGGETKDHILSTVEMPSILKLSSKTTIDSQWITSINKSTEGTKPFDNRTVSIINTNRPSGMTLSRSHDTTFPIDKSSHISQINNPIRDCKRMSLPLLINTNSQPITQSSQFNNRNSNILTDGSISFLRIQSSNSLLNFRDTNSCSPMPILSIDDIQRLPGKIELLNSVFQSGMTNTDFTSCLAESNLPSLYALRNFLRNTFQHSDLLCMDWKYLIINYDILHAWLSSIELLGQLDLLIADEIHFCKSKTTRRSQALFSIKANKIIGLSGTPILNKPVELQPILEFLQPKNPQWKFWPYVQNFCNAHKVQITKSRSVWDFSGASKLSQLQEMLRVELMIRRTKDEVLKELPPKRRQIIELPQNGVEKILEEENKAWQKNEDKIASLKVKAELAKTESEEAYFEAVEQLREANLSSFEELSKLRHKTAVAKVPAVIEHIKDSLENEEKIVLFAHHHDVIDQIYEAFPKISVRLTGRDNQENRQKAIDSFQNNPDCKLFIGSITAAGVGITLTASSHVIFAELDWVPSNVSQAESRLDRIGQVNSVLVQHLVFNDSLDARMAKTIVAKQEVIDKALDTEGGLQNCY